MLLQQERTDIVSYSKQLLARGLTVGSGGNISVYNRAEGLIALTPSGLSYAGTAPEDITLIDIDGKITDGVRRPSSEIHMHLAVYRARPDVNAIVHTHSLYATAISCTGRDLAPVHYLLATAGPVVKCAPYALFGTEELAQNALAALGNRGACLLGNHGVLAVGPTLPRAFTTAELIEYVAKLFCVTKNLGAPHILTEQQMRDAAQAFQSYPYQ
ncbi:MAG: L-fuculose-phosphate aldolase [Clostridiales bacterium]|nr:L-fuculose-phosphate aldolase [Clostridiales bacterium]